MTDQNQMNEFVQIYNENIMEGSSDIPSTRKALEFNSDNTHSKKAKGKWLRLHVKKIRRSVNVKNDANMHAFSRSKNLKNQFNTG